MPFHPADLSNEEQYVAQCLMRPGLAQGVYFPWLTQLDSVLDALRWDLVPEQVLIDRGAPPLAAHLLVCRLIDGYLPHWRHNPSGLLDRVNRQRRRWLAMLATSRIALALQADTCPDDDIDELVALLS